MTPEPLSEEPMTEEELSEIEARIAVVCGAPGPSVIRALIAEIRRLHLQVEFWRSEDEIGRSLVKELRAEVERYRAKVGA